MVDEITSFSGENRFLSNFWPSPIWWLGLKFPTVEHAFQATKTTDQEMRIAISVAATPGRAKRIGRTLELRPHWESTKEDVMWQLLQRKFVPDSKLAKQLVATHPAELVEGNTWGDIFWGRVDGQGQNKLGFLLMRWREELMED